jgi:hypothetical protein
LVRVTAVIPDDVLVADALAVAVAAIEPEPGVEFGEMRHLQPAVLAALWAAFGAEGRNRSGE